VIANLFLHYAFDTWLSRELLDVAFERYADDGVVHCVSLERAEEVLAAVTGRMERVGLVLHPDKARIVYCKDNNRRGTFGCTSFTFLGYTFRTRASRDKKGRQLLAFLPAVSTNALKRIGGVVRRWRLHRRIYHTLDQLADGIEPRRGGLDAVLRPVLPVASVSAPCAHQRLPGAMNPQQASTTRRSPGVSAAVRRDSRRRSNAVQALGMGPHRLVARMTRAR